MSRAKKPARKLAVIDLETDPFLYGRIPKPFAAAFFDGEIYREFWGKDCVQYLLDFLLTLEEPYVIYAHNGGKFDFFYFLEALENPLKIINGRIAKANYGPHEFRDSYSIIPIPLAAYEKDKIDYSWFEESERNKHKADILHYLAKDCEYLFKLVAAFRERFGDKLTIGGTAISKLKELHPFFPQNEAHDTRFRPYYFGGRVEAFKTGVIHGDYKVYDVNSMYPFVMRNRLHPTGRNYAQSQSAKITASGFAHGFGQRPFFISVEGTNYGAFPTRTKQGLDFNIKKGLFNTTSHELQAALACGKFKIGKIHSILIPHQTISFEDYVDKYIVEKIEGKKTGDKVREIFAKLLLNSAYGKFGQNPDNYFDYKIIRDISEIPREEWDKWDLYERHGEIAIWRKKSERKSYFDVATAASITGASRAVLLEAIAASVDPIYCDTDSIICQDYPGEKDATALGAWKLEAEADKVAIAGKKLYAAWSGKDVVKAATKGARLTADEILSICKGGKVHWQNQAPSFSIAGGAKFIDRQISATI